MCRGLVRGDGGGLKPWEILDLTWAELADLYSDDAGDKTDSGAPNMCEAEIMEYAAWLFSLTPLERVEKARAGELLL